MTANVAGRLLSMAAWLLVTPLVLSAMGSTRFGLWSLVTMLTGLSLSLDLGVSATVTRFVAAHRERGDEAGMRGACSAGALVALALGMMWSLWAGLWPAPLLDFAKVTEAARPEAAGMLRVMGLAFLLNLLALTVTAAISAFQRFDLVSRNLLGATLVQFVGFVIAARSHATLAGFAWAAVASSAVALALALLSIREIWPGLRRASLAETRAALREFGEFGVALQAINLGVLALYQVPKLILTRGVSLAAVGQFELGYRVAFSVWSLPTLLLPPLLPAAAQLQAAGERERLARLYLRASRYVLALAMPLATVLVALSAPLFTCWLGPGHAAEARANAAIAGLLGVNVLTSAGSLLARGMGRPWWEAGYLALALVIQVGCGPALTRLFGFDGALAAMLLAGMAGTAGFLFVFHRAIGQPLAPFLRDVVAAPALAALAGGSAAWLASGGHLQALSEVSRGAAFLALARGGGAAVVVTLAALFGLRALTVSELRELLSRARGGAGGGTTA